MQGNDLSDEAHFYLGGYVNNREKHPKRVTVWCAFWAGGFIEAHFFENDESEAVNEPSTSMWHGNGFFVVNLRNINTEEIYFH